MQCRAQPRLLARKSLLISDLLEIRLAPLQWNRIKIAACQRRRTYSTITRYCVLRLATKCSLRWTARLQKTTVAVRAGLAAAQETHRHMMCLYGDDVKIIRVAAMELGLTITAFVRLAIELFLLTPAMEKHSPWVVSNQKLTWEGIRLTDSVQIFAVNGGDRPFYRHLTCIPFAIESYW